MAQPQPENRTSLNEVLRLVDSLSPSDKSAVRRALDQSWAQRWQALRKQIREDNKDLPPITDEEILAEIKAARADRRAC
jgi:hypothetical protein